MIVGRAATAGIPDLLSLSEAASFRDATEKPWYDWLTALFD